MYQNIVHYHLELINSYRWHLFPINSLTKGLKFPCGYQKDLKLELLTVLSFLTFVQLQNQQQYQAVSFYAD